MTHSYALVRLLEHGPLQWRELVEITGWPSSSLWDALCRCLDVGEVVRLRELGTREFLYARA